MGVNGEALQLCIVLFFTTSHVRIRINTTSHMTICISTTSYVRIHIRYYKSRENPYHILQVTCAASERAMKSNVSTDEIIITIVPSYTRKNITCLLLLASLLQQTLDIFRYSFVLWWYLRLPQTTQQKGAHKQRLGTRLVSNPYLPFFFGSGFASQKRAVLEGKDKTKRNNNIQKKKNI